MSKRQNASKDREAIRKAKHQTTINLERRSLTNINWCLVVKYRLVWLVVFMFFFLLLLFVFVLIFEGLVFWWCTGDFVLRVVLGRLFVVVFFLSISPLRGRGRLKSLEGGSVIYCACLRPPLTPLKPTKLPILF